MRIAVVGTGGEGALALGLARGASACGHHAELVNAASLIAGARPLILARRARQEELMVQPLIARLRRQLSRLQPDLVLIVKGRFISAKGVGALRRQLKVPILNYYPDHPLWPGFGEPQLLEALSAYDEVLVWSDILTEPLAVEGVGQVRVIPFAYDPGVYRPPSGPVGVTWDTVLLGQHYPERVPYVEILADRRILVSGLGWDKAARQGPLAGRAVSRSYGGTKTCEMYWRSATALNILSVANVPAHNMRTFEIPASGTVMVATRTPEHVAFVGEDGAVLVDSPQEARERVLQLLQEPEQLEGIARRGRERVAQHTYAARMEELLRPWVSRRTSESARRNDPHPYGR